MKKNVILEKTFNFSLGIISLYQTMISQREYVISRQILKSGTSIGENVHEANDAQSKKDFISKMNIALKEARETKYWMMLLERSGIVEVQLFDLFAEIEEIISILIRIIKTSKENLAKT